MIIRDIEPGKYFIIDGDMNYPFLRVETGYYNIVDDIFTDKDMGRSVTPVEYWAVEKVCYQYEIYPANLQQYVAEALEKYKKPNYEEKEIYFFVCTKCHKSRRTTLKKDKAVNGLCRKCLSIQADPRQSTLFSLEPDANTGS